MRRNSNVPEGGKLAVSSISNVYILNGGSYKAIRRFETNQTLLKTLSINEKRQLIIALLTELSNSFYSLSKTFGIGFKELEDFLGDHKLISSPHDEPEEPKVDINKAIDELFDGSDTDEDDEAGENL